MHWYSRQRTSGYTFLVAFTTLLPGVLKANLAQAATRKPGSAMSHRQTRADTDHPGNVAPSVDGASSSVGTTRTAHRVPAISGSDTAPSSNEAPPSSNDAAPSSNDAATSGSEAGKRNGKTLDFSLGLQWWLVRDKAILGPVMRIGGRWISGHMEFSPIRLLDKSPYLESKWLGSIFGLYFTVSPVKTKRVEAHLGLGPELHWLFGIHSEEVNGALGARASLHWWFDKNVAVFGTFRTYLAPSAGLELGATRRGVRNLPVMFSIGVEMGDRK